MNYYLYLRQCVTCNKMQNATATIQQGTGTTCPATTSNPSTSRPGLDQVQPNKHFWWFVKMVTCSCTCGILCIVTIITPPE